MIRAALLRAWFARKSPWSTKATRPMKIHLSLQANLIVSDSFTRTRWRFSSINHHFVFSKCLRLRSCLTICSCHVVGWRRFFVQVRPRCICAMTIARSCIEHVRWIMPFVQFAGMWHCVPIDVRIANGWTLLPFFRLNEASYTTDCETDGSNNNDDNNRWGEIVR